MGRVPVPCIVCGDPTTPGPRCRRCERVFQAARNKKPSRADYRSTEYRNFVPSGLCAICGKPGTPDDPLTRGHVRPVSKGGTARDGLRAEHRSCNARRGNAS